TGPSGGATDPSGGATTGLGGGVIDLGGGAIDLGGGAIDLSGEDAKQNTIAYLISFIIPTIKQKINLHNHIAWDEYAEDYNISGSNQLFDVIEYDNAQSQKTKYNVNDNRSKTIRREMYLGFGYNVLAIKAFGALANKMVATKNVQMKTELENMVKKIRQYARAFYSTAYNTLINKKDKLMELDLNDLQILIQKFPTINSSDQKIYSAFVKPITNDYYNNIEIGTAKHTLQDNATAEEIQAYLNGKFTSNESEFNTVIDTANEIAGILNKIQ
ncbi:virulence associated lipoprotein, partial [Borrelia hermsii]